MRKLASIQRIKSLEPIAGADSIEMAIVLGWQLVVKKGEFQVNDLCVYFEIDSIYTANARGQNESGPDNAYDRLNFILLVVILFICIKLKGCIW